MPRKKLQRTPFGSVILPLGCYVVQVAYHRDEDFATTDRELLQAKLDAFDRFGWKYKVARVDFHVVPAGRPTMEREREDEDEDEDGGLEDGDRTIELV